VTVVDGQVRVETVDQAHLKQWQQTRLLEVIEFAYANSALTGQLWDRAGVHPDDIRGITDFKRKVPLIRKPDVLAFAKQHGDPFGGLLGSELGQCHAVGSTSGTTGTPMPLPLTGGGAMQTALARDFRMLGHRPGDYLVFNIPSFRPCHFGDFFQALDARPILLDHSPRASEALIEASLRFRPTVLYMLSSPLIQALAEYQHNHSVDMHDVFSGYRAVIYGGEPLSRRLRAVVAGWGVQPINHCAVADVQGATECHARAGMHIWEDQVFVECLDFDTLADVADGEVGELVATSLGRDHAPLVRFGSGDAVRLTHQPCQCGRTHARIQIAGRKQDQVIVSGKSVFPQDVWDAVESVTETSAGLFQVLQSSHGSEVLHIRVGHADPLRRSLATVREELESLIGSQTGLDVSIELVPAQALLQLGPPHKIPRVARQ
jgi:phenylacetate-CoA ligase